MCPIIRAMKEQKHTTCLVNVNTCVQQCYCLHAHSFHDAFVEAKEQL